MDQDRPSAAGRHHKLSVTITVQTDAGPVTGTSTSCAVLVYGEAPTPTLAPTAAPTAAPFAPSHRSLDRSSDGSTHRHSTPDTRDLDHPRRVPFRNRHRERDSFGFGQPHADGIGHP
jgi:hypothetical protein